MTIYDQALVIRQELGDRVGEGHVLHHIALVYQALGRLNEALEVAEKSLEIRREVGEFSDISDTLNLIGVIYDVYGQSSKAFEYFNQAISIANQIGDRAAQSATFQNMAVVYDNQGRYGDALEFYNRALRISQEIGNHFGEGRIRYNIAGLYRDRGSNEQALEFSNQALAIVREYGDRATEGRILGSVIAAIHLDQDHYQDALESANQALLILRELGDLAGEGEALNNIAVAYNDLGRYDEALENYNKSLTIALNIGDRDGEGRIRMGIANIYRDKGRYDDAIKTYGQALAILREVSDRVGEGITLDNMAIAFSGQNRYSKAVDTYNEAIQAFESVRTVAGSDLGRTQFIAQYIPTYNRLIDLYDQQNQGLASFFTSERGRARAFLDSLSTGHVELSDNTAANLLASEQEAYAVRQATQDALARAKMLNPPDPVLVVNLEEQLAAAETNYHSSLSAIQSHQDRLADLVPGRNTNVLALDTVQVQLDNQTTLISYWMLGDKTVAFIVSADNFMQVDLPNATTEQVSAALQGFYQWRNPENPHPLPLRNLYRWLVEPLVEHLQTPHVAIVPHQLLHYIPFAALTDGQTYFGQKYILSLLPSASVLPFINENARNGHITGTPTAVVFGNPKTVLAALPYAEAEAQAVADLIGAAVYTGTQASELQLRAVVSGVNILHLAAHGDYNLANPFYSAITLAADDEDGLLETHEIFGLPLKGNDLVVLSACQTSLNELTETSAVAVSRGDEIVGLTRAFFFAGAPTVIASLWSVNDAATETLMVAFYKHWLDEGMSKAQALQAAQADVRADPRWASPFYWAGFVLNGHPGKSHAE